MGSVRRYTVLVTIAGLLILSGCTAQQARRFSHALRDAGIQQYLDRAVAFMVTEYANEKESVMAIREPQGYGDVVGRWFTKATVLDRADGTVSITFSGPGYRGHPEASNVMFKATSTCVYKPEVQIDENYAYVTFTPQAEPQLSFEVFRITAMAEWGNTPVHRQEATEQGSIQFLAILRQGFTVAMNRNLETETWVGIGPRQRAPVKPYWVVPGEHDIANDSFQVREDGIDLVGPIHLEPGDTLRLDVCTQASWGMDCYLMDDANARAVLANHVDRDNNPLSNCTCIFKNESTKQWQQVFTAQGRTVVWLLIDNRDGGGSSPPANFSDDIVSGTLYLGVAHPK